MHTLDDNLVALFIEKWDEKYNHKLTNTYNYSRVVCLADFEKIIKKKNISPSNLAVVSGSNQEPELKLINYKHIHFLNYESSSGKYDLDSVWKNDNSSLIKEKYDFVMCNQVLEHIASPFQGMKNLSHITLPGGYLWVSIPTINCIHGEPWFYSSGYHPRMLQKLGEQAGLKIVHLGAWGNKKYLVQAVQGNWLTEKQLKRGFRNMNDLAFPYFAIQDGRKNQINKNIITDTWALYQKI